MQTVQIDCDSSNLAKLLSSKFNLRSDKIDITSMPLVANSVLYSHFASHSQVLTTVATSKSGHSIALLLAQTRICLELRIMYSTGMTLIVRILF